MVQVTVNKPNRPKGSEVLVPGIGRLKNGETHEVNDERAATYDIPKVIGQPLASSSSKSSSPPSSPTTTPVGSRSQEGASDTESLVRESGNIDAGTSADASASGEEAS